jgi:hypothetical protein
MYEGTFNDNGTDDDQGMSFGDEMPYALPRSGSKSVEYVGGRVYGEPCPFRLEQIEGKPSGMRVVLIDGNNMKPALLDVTQEELDVRIATGNLYLVVVSDGEQENTLRFYLFEGLKTKEPALLFARSLKFPDGTYASSEAETWEDLIPYGDDESAMEAFAFDEHWRGERGLPVICPDDED